MFIYIVVIQHKQSYTIRYNYVLLLAVNLKTSVDRLKNKLYEYLNEILSTKWWIAIPELLGKLYQIIVEGGWKTFSQTRN